MGNAETYSDSRVRETGVKGFKTILEVKPAFLKDYRALGRDIASCAKLERKKIKSGKDYISRSKNRAELESKIGKKLEFLLGQYLGRAGIEYKECEEIDGEKKTDYRFYFAENGLPLNHGGIGIYDSKNYINAFPNDAAVRLFTGYDMHVIISPDKSKGIQAEIQLEEKGSLEIRHVSNALCVLFPKSYNGLGIPAITYKRPRQVHEVHEGGVLSIAPLSRLPQVKEHIQELGKELSPRLQDLEEFLREMRQVSGRNSKMAKEIRHTLHREYLYTLLEAMGRGI